MLSQVYESGAMYEPDKHDKIRNLQKIVAPTNLALTDRYQLS